MRRPCSQPFGGDPLWLRHEALNGLILKDPTGLPAWARRVVVGHHGRYQPAVSSTRELDRLYERIADPAWVRVQAELISAAVTGLTVVTGVDASLGGWPGSA